ncbi:MAG: hypothetical protein ACFE9L_13370 [Candidatus Hodarchaeota archaeon]
MQTLSLQSNYFGQLPNIIGKDLRGMTYEDIEDWISSKTKMFDHYLSPHDS